MACSGSYDLYAASGELVGLNAGLLAISLTLIALFPALLEIVRIQSPSFLAGEDARLGLRKGLRRLTFTIWIFSLTILISLVGIIYPNLVFAILVLIMTVSGLVILVFESYRIASAIISAV